MDGSKPWGAGDMVPTHRRPRLDRRTSREALDQDLDQLLLQPYAASPSILCAALHQRSHTHALLIAPTPEWGRWSPQVDQTAAHCLIFFFSRNSSLISNWSAIARHLFPS